MSDSQFCAVRKIIVWTKQRDLRDQIESILSATPIRQHSIQSTRDIPDLIHLCGQNFGSLGLVDLTSINDSVSETVTAIHEFCLTGREACLIALTDHGQIENTCLFKVGFRGVICGFDLAKIGPLATRYWDSVRWPPQNITELVISNLPWRAIE